MTLWEDLKYCKPKLKLSEFEQNYFEFIYSLKSQGLTFYQIKEVMETSMDKYIKNEALKLIKKDVSQTNIAIELGISTCKLARIFEIGTKYYKKKRQVY